MGCASPKRNVDNDDAWCNSHLLQCNLQPEVFKRSEIKLDKFIQQGGMGVVYSGSNSSKHRIACKLFGYNYQKPDEDTIWREINLLLSLQGIEGIVKMYGIFTDTKNGIVKGKYFPFEYPAIVMEYLEGGDFYARINSSVVVSENDIAIIFRKIIITLGEIHGRGFIHRDMKPENIMLLSDQRDSPVRLIDCGYMVVLPEGRSVYKGATVVGSPGYVAPESISHREYSAKSDIWQIGCCLYSMLSGLQAFHPDTDLKVIAKGTYMKMTGDAWDSISQDAKHLVKSILVKDPMMRPSIEEILAHPWLGEKAPTEGLGDMYLARIKHLGLRQKMRKFFQENDREQTDLRKREIMKVFLPFQRENAGGTDADALKEFDRRLINFQTLVVRQMRSGKLLEYESTQLDSMTLHDSGILKSYSSEFLCDSRAEREDNNDRDRVPRVVTGDDNILKSRSIELSMGPSVLSTGTDEIDCSMFKRIAKQAELPELANDVIFGIFDQDGNGRIDIREFLITMLAFRPAELTTIEDTIRLYFNVFDHDKSGFISREELDVAVLCATLSSVSSGTSPSLPTSTENEKYAPTRRQASFLGVASNSCEMFEAINVSGSGLISYEEFEQFYRSIMACGSHDNI